jgi:pimeloyl-ACP methyl ester carboxylesterase
MPLPPGVPVAPVILYLHGFASSSGSAKAGYFRGRLRARGVSFRCPDLNEPDFRSLTLTRMLNQVAREVSDSGEASVTLMGSSLGGALAVLAAERLGARVENLILLAPAVMFAKPGHHLLPPERIDEWRRRGELPFYHYGYKEERPLDVEFYEDSQRYDPFNAAFAQPALVFQGLRDQSVDHRTVEHFARDRRNVTLSLLDDDHQLMASLPRIWSDVEAFLGLVD